MVNSTVAYAWSLEWAGVGFLLSVPLHSGTASKECGSCHQEMTWVVFLTPSLLGVEANSGH